MASDVHPLLLTNHSRTTLRHLLHKLRSRSSRHFSRYGQYLESAPEQIEALIYSCVRPEVLRHVEHGMILSSNAYVLSITYSTYRRKAAKLSSPLIDTRISILHGLTAPNSHTTFHGRSIYLHTIYGTDGKVRLYIGQAYNAAFRINQHLDFRYRREHRSLHYYAMEKSASDSFFILATVTAPSTQPGMQRPDLVLNILEMWCCLLFQTLQLQQLEEWLPPGSVIRHDVGRLNVALPLDQGDPQAAKGTIKLLEDCTDPLVREYYDMVRHKPPPESQVDVAPAKTNAGRIVLAVWGLCAAALMVRIFTRRRPA